MNNLYLISQDVNDDYDTYDSAVVVAENEEQAKLIHPSTYRGIWPNDKWNNETKSWEWTRPDNVQVRLIGTATHEFELNTVICASYNAG